MHRILQSSSKLREYNSMLRDKYIKQEGNFDQERKKWSKKLGGVVVENQNLQFENASKAISLAESEAKYDIKLKEIKLLRDEMKLLKGKLDLSQKDSSKKGSEIESLKSKIVELALQISELERLKPEDISKSIIGGDVEGQSLIVPTIKNTQSEEQSSITKFDDISAVIEPSKNLSKYFIRGKSMNQAEKNDTEINPKISDS
ncbi:1628_t:CDS:1, partial [Entrophospora sp. SA101]